MSGKPSIGPAPRKRNVVTAAALRRREARARGILETAVDAIVTIDQRGIIESFNPSAERMFGYAAAEVVGRPVSLLMPPPHNRTHDRHIQRYLQTGQARVIGIGREVDARRKDGAVFPVDLTIGEQRVGPERFFTGILRDITERKRLEHEILEISARERRRIGQDLHDGVGQNLTGVAFLSKALAERLKARNLPEARDAQKIVDLVNQAISETRQLARGLYPVENPAGLVPALEELARMVEHTCQVSCALRADPVTLVPDMATATHLYRIAQEAINNAVRHGHARHIELSLRSAENTLRLMIRDDGSGYRSDWPRGLGLRTMNYRARLIGAVLDVRGAPAGGTVVTCTLEAPGPAVTRQETAS